MLIDNKIRTSIHINDPADSKLEVTTKEKEIDFVGNTNQMYRSIKAAS